MQCQPITDIESLEILKKNLASSPAQENYFNLKKANAAAKSLQIWGSRPMKIPQSCAADLETAR